MAHPRGNDLAVLTMSGPGEAQVAMTKALTLQGAQQVIAAATAEARRQNVTIAIVDEGQPRRLERLDGSSDGL